MNVIYYLRGQELDNSTFSELLIAVVKKACGEKIPTGQNNDIIDFKAHSLSQAELVNIVSSRPFLEKYFERELESHLCLNIPAADNPMIVQLCRFFQRKLSDIDLLGVAFRYAFDEKLNKNDIELVKRFQSGSKEDREFIERFRSRKYLKRLLKDILCRESIASEPIEKNNYVLKLLKGLGYDPGVCFKNGMILKALEMELVSEEPVEKELDTRDVVYFLRGNRLNKSGVTEMHYRIMMHKMDAKMSKKKLQDVYDYEAESDMQKNVAEMYRKEETLQLHYYLAIEKHMVSGEELKNNPFIIQCCKYFKRPLETLQMNILAVRQACNQQLTGKQMTLLEKGKSSAEGRDSLSSVVSPEALHKMIEDALYYSAFVPGPFFENKFLHMLLQGIEVKPEQFFDKLYLTLKYDKDIVENLKWC